MHRLMSEPEAFATDLEHLVANASGSERHFLDRPTAEDRTMFEIVAEIEGGFDDRDVLCAFDPNKVVARLCREFPGTVVDPKDYAWRDFDLFIQHGVVDESGVLGVAARDARRRGPVWLFRLATDGEPVGGSAERHHVRFHSDAAFPEPLRSRLIDFVERLRFAPCVRVKCVRLDDNDEYPA